MRQIRFFSMLVVTGLIFSACGLLGSDGNEVAIAEDVTPVATVNNVQAAPVTPEANATGGQDAVDDGSAAFPTAITLPTSAPTPEPTVDRSQPTTYIVQSGDVLGLIAERFDADIAEVRRVNGLDGNLIRVGQELTIPAAEPAASTTESAEAAPAATSAPQTTTTTTTTSSGPVSCNSAATGHCVQPGESLLGIAVKYDVTVDAIRAANPGISGDLIRSGDVLNLPGSTGATTTTTDTTTTTTDTTTTITGTNPVATVGPINDADCAARNPEFPFFHASDGLCYANPIGGTTTTNALGETIQTTPQPTSSASEDDCRDGFFLWSDGLCYPIPGVTVVATPGPTTAAVQDNYGRPPCRDGYVELVATSRCWPEGTNTNPTTVTPVPTAATTTTGTTTSTTTTTSTGTATTCDGVNFVAGTSGTCFLTQEGADANCEVIDNVAYCP